MSSKASTDQPETMTTADLNPNAQLLLFREQCLQQAESLRSERDKIAEQVHKIWESNLKQIPNSEITHRTSLKLSVAEIQYRSRKAREEIARLSLRMKPGVKNKGLLHRIAEKVAEAQALNSCLASKDLAYGQGQEGVNTEQLFLEEELEKAQSALRQLAQSFRRTKSELDDIMDAAKRNAHEIGDELIMIAEDLNTVTES